MKVPLVAVLSEPKAIAQTAAFESDEFAGGGWDEIEMRK